MVDFVHLRTIILSNSREEYKSFLYKYASMLCGLPFVESENQVDDLALSLMPPDHNAKLPLKTTGNESCYTMLSLLD